MKTIELSCNGKTKKFTFDIRKVYDGLRIYLISFPKMEKYRGTCSHDAHCYWDSKLHKNYICWDSPITSYRDANAIMFVWAKNYLFNCLGKINGMKYSVALEVGTFRASKRTYYMTKEVYDEIKRTIGSKRAEAGGMLGSRDGITVDTYVFDPDAKTGVSSYSPNVKFLNDTINNDWAHNRTMLIGFVHSHPAYFRQLSSSDLEYAGRIMKSFNIDNMFMPIVMTKPDTGNYELLPFSAYFDKYGNVRYSKCDIVITDSEEEGLSFLDIEAAFNNMRLNDISEKKEELHDTAFDRISNVIDLNIMNKVLLIGVGCGGSREFYLDMARMGVFNFVLIDGDTVSNSNISSQNTYLDEVGIFKPEAIKERIININPNAKVKCVNDFLSDKYDDAYFANLMDGYDKVLICGFTDSFMAQARCTRLAMKYKTMYLSAQHYRRGELSEIIYWYPRVSQTTVREYQSSRYDGYSSGYVNDVTSKGSPIFNTVRLNSLCEKIALGMILYKDCPNSLYTSFLRTNPESNLILVRQGVLTDEFEKFNVFFDNEKSMFDDAVWLSASDIECTQTKDKYDYLDKNNKDIDTRCIY